MENKKFYNAREEKANYLTHAFGLLMGVVATVVLLRRAIEAGNGWAIVVYAVFGFGMLVCMLSSTYIILYRNPCTRAIVSRVGI